MYRHLNNQVLNNLEADFVETYISLCSLHALLQRTEHDESTKILPLFCGQQEASQNLRFFCNLFPWSWLFRVNFHFLCPPSLTAHNVSRVIWVVSTLLRATKRKWIGLQPEVGNHLSLWYVPANNQTNRPYGFLRHAYKILQKPKCWKLMDEK